MKTKEKENLKNLSLDELKSELRQLQETRFNTVFKHSSGSLSNPLEIRELRKKTAMIKTFIKEKEAANVNK